jgi:hypothetical protein
MLAQRAKPISVMAADEHSKFNLSERQFAAVIELQKLIIETNVRAEAKIMVLMDLCMRILEVYCKQDADKEVFDAIINNFEERAKWVREKYQKDIDRIMNECCKK